jgi:hypothetical protein
MKLVLQIRVRIRQGRTRISRIAGYFVEKKAGRKER